MVRQPYGAICLTAPGAREINATNCPTASQRKQPVKMTPSGQIIDGSNCKVTAQLCRDKSDTCTSFGSPDVQNWDVMLMDGNVHVSYFQPLEENTDLLPDFANLTDYRLHEDSLDSQLLYSS